MMLLMHALWLLLFAVPGVGVVYGTKQGQIACALSPLVLRSCGLLAEDSSI